MVADVILVNSFFVIQEGLVVNLKSRSEKVEEKQVVGGVEKEVSEH